MEDKSLFKLNQIETREHYQCDQGIFISLIENPKDLNVK